MSERSERINKHGQTCGCGAATRHLSACVPTGRIISGTAAL